MLQCDAEIVYLEEFQREQDVQLSAVRSEAGRLEAVLAESNQQVRSRLPSASLCLRNR